MCTYEIKETSNVVTRTDENGVVSAIPMDLGNSDYQAYLKSLEAEQSTPSLQLMVVSLYGADTTRRYKG